MDLTTLRSELERATVAFLWRQWSQLGVSAASEGGDGWCVDPEVLLVATLELGRTDARLFDEVLDWLAENAALLSLQRVKNLVRADPGYPRHVLAAACDAVRATGARLPWRIAADVPGSGEREALFSGRQADVATLPSRMDPAFARFGLVRGRFVRSRKSQRPVAGLPANLWVRLREAMGVTSRAEVARVLLLHPGRGLAVADLARHCLYAKRNVQVALDSLATAELVVGVRSGNERVWRAHTQRWFAWLGIEGEQPPLWLDWRSLSRGLQALWRGLSARGWDDVSAGMQASEARRLMTAAAPALMAAVPGWQPPDGRAYRGEAYLGAFADAVARLLRWLESGRQT